MCGDGCESYHGDHFTVYTHIKLLCYSPATTITPYVNYISISSQIKPLVHTLENLSKT